MKLLIIVFVCLISSNSVFAQPVDTIYYNSEWQICEKARADYYRICTVKSDSGWIFTGSVKDYQMNGTPHMEGHYDSNGFRDGDFIFYYPDGKKEAQGRFIKDRFHGNWQFYYPDGKNKARIYYSGDALLFVFIEYIDEKGNYLVKDGTGKFNIPVIEIYGDRKYLLKGEFINGDREGDWEYRVNDNNLTVDIRHKEVYKNGEFKKGQSIGEGKVYREFNKPNFAASFMSFKKFKNTEEFAVSSASGSFDDFLKNKHITQTYTHTYGNSRDTVGALTKVEIEASFPGGVSAWRKFLEQNLKGEILAETVPASIKKYKQTVLVRFIICEDGTVCNVEVSNKEEGFKPVQQEAVRAISTSGKWVPAVNEGKYVKSFHTQPITFVYTSE
jgi:hypothetical protein